MNTETRQCQNCHGSFVIEPDDFAFYEKIDVPPPTWCPECRLQRRLAFTNDRALYKRNCDLCDTSTMSSHPPERKVTLYCNTCWWSDKWDGAEYAQEYDFSRPFFEQFRELIRKTPQMALDSNYPTLVNSEYVNHSSTAKNCYLIFTADECENVLYSEYLLHNKDTMDCTMVGGSELCYSLINSGPCYRTFFSEDCENCHDVYFSKDCNGCSNCLGCVGLRKKKHHIFNKPYTSEDYQKELQKLHMDSYGSIENLKRQAIAFWQKYPYKFSHALRNRNVTGDYVYSSKNARDMYVIHEGAEDCRYCQLMTMTGIKDAYDYSIWGNGAQRMYECMIAGEGADTVKFSYQAWPNVREIEYGFFVISSSYMFGCANIRNKQYCILNKQYTKDEYEVLIPRIKKHMDEMPYVDARGREYRYGEFFPPELALVGYNESYAADYFPLTREKAGLQGFSWYVPQPNPHQPTITAQDIPDSINDTQDSLLKEIIACEVCANPFRIIPAELMLLRRFGLPVPHKCPNCRYRERRNRINPPRLCHRTCQCAGGKSENGTYQNTTTHQHGDAPCPNEFETSYSPDRKETVYCESCYNAEVV